jgi:hypothetical protein
MMARLALLPMEETKLFPCPARDQSLNPQGWILGMQTFSGTAGVPAVKQNHLEQCVAKHRKSLVRFVGAQPGSVECFHKQVGVIEGVTDGKLNSVLGCNSVRHGWEQYSNVGIEREG